MQISSCFAILFDCQAYKIHTYLWCFSFLFLVFICIINITKKGKYSSIDFEVTILTNTTVFFSTKKKCSLEPHNKNKTVNFYSEVNDDKDNIQPDDLPTYDQISKL